MINNSWWFFQKLLSDESFSVSFSLSSLLWFAITVLLKKKNHIFLFVCHYFGTVMQGSHQRRQRVDRKARPVLRLSHDNLVHHPTRLSCVSSSLWLLCTFLQIFFLHFSFCILTHAILLPVFTLNTSTKVFSQYARSWFGIQPCTKHEHVWFSIFTFAIMTGYQWNSMKGSHCNTWRFTASACSFTNILQTVQGITFLWH